jgi:XTP/dITP diphosphohydrolase
MNCQLNDRIKILLQFATSNVNKVEEVRLILKDYPIVVEPINAKTVEIQADAIEEVASTSAKRAAQERKIPLFVEDTGFFIDALKGFPGPYASYVYKTVGRTGILKLLHGKLKRRAEFKSVVAFCIPGEEAVCFVGVVSGTISRDERGSSGFGFDSIFMPEEGFGKTFAEMTIDEKNACSHRAQSVKKFADWYLEHF